MRTIILLIFLKFNPIVTKTLRQVLNRWLKTKPWISIYKDTFVIIWLFTMWHLWWHNRYCSEPEDFCLNLRIGICICSVLGSFKAWCCWVVSGKKEEQNLHIMSRLEGHEEQLVANERVALRHVSGMLGLKPEGSLSQDMLCDCSPCFCIQGNVVRWSNLIFDLSKTWKLWRSVSKILFSFRCWWPLTGSKDMSCVDHVLLSVINTTFLLIIPTSWT